MEKCYIILWLEELSENLRITSKENKISLNIKVESSTTWKLYMLGTSFASL